MKKNFQFMVAVGLLVGPIASQAVPIVHTTDFIAEAERTNFNSFETMFEFYDGSIPYVEDGIRVQQINDDPGLDIWTGSFSNYDGAHGWYVNGGDYGYTSLSLADGSDFGDMGFYISGTYHQWAFFELLDDGAVVLSGSVAHPSPFHYLGFAGGGFDTVLLRDGVAGSTLHDGTYNAITLDAIETRPASVTVPEPGTLALFGFGIAGLGFVRHRRKQPSVLM